MNTATSRRLLLLTAAILCAGPAQAGPSRDGMTVGSVPAVAAGQVLLIPIYVRDSSGTTLGADQAPGRAIQDLVVTVEPSPANAVSAIAFQRAGLTSNLEPNYEVQVPAGDRLSWIVSFSEANSPLAFTPDAPGPGDHVADLFVRLSDSLAPNAAVRLGLVGATSALGNQQGTVVETEPNGRLALVDGELGMSAIFADGFESGDTAAW